METKELMRKVQEIELKTRKMTKQAFSGEYSSAFKGKGMTFSEVRNYQFQDDVRNIDWNVTARFNEPYVKIFHEERELSVFLILDLSGSTNFGTAQNSKRDLLLETTAILAFSAIKNNDKVGAVFVRDKVEKYIPPKKGRAHALLILRELIRLKTGGKTNLNEGLKFFRNIIKRRSICFVISDFFDENDFFDGFKIAQKRHDMVAIRLSDAAEKELLNHGLTKLVDMESGKQHWVRTSSKKVREKYKKDFQQFEENLTRQFQRLGIDVAHLSTNGKHVRELNRLFLMRNK